MSVRVGVLVLGVLGLARVGLAENPTRVAPRASSREDLTAPVERYVTPNGLVVLLCPDERMNAVVVDLGFAAGALHQPAGKGGLAHLTEHVIASGVGTDYRDLLEQRGTIRFSAFTTLDRMNFRVTVPPEELPLALWVDADRLGGLAGATLEVEALRRHQRIVAQERLHRIDDLPYGGNVVSTMRSLFPQGHPLRAGIIGSRDEINALTPADVLGFARTRLVPANGVLTVVGRFEPAVAKERIAAFFDAIPAGQAAPRSASLPRAPASRVTVTEELGRRTRVTYGWTLDDPSTQVSEALAFGSMLMTVSADGFAGLDVLAAWVPMQHGGIFTLDVTMPFALDKATSLTAADLVLRFLAEEPMPKDLVNATLLAWDRDLMVRLHSADALASLLADQEARPRKALQKLTAAERHWALTPEKLLSVGGGTLRGPRVTVIANPSKPLPRGAR